MHLRCRLALFLPPPGHHRVPLIPHVLLHDGVGVHLLHASAAGLVLVGTVSSTCVLPVHMPKARQRKINKKTLHAKEGDVAKHVK